MADSTLLPATNTLSVLVEVGTQDTSQSENGCNVAAGGGGRSKERGTEELRS